MTQAYNLSQFANTVNSSGQASNSGLQNSSLTVTAGDGMSGGGSVALGSSVTLTNAGVTALTAGTGISVSASTGSITISNTSTGAVTSVSGGNGITTSGSTSVTVALGVPSDSSVGTYTMAIASIAFNSQGPDYTIGTNIAGSSLRSTYFSYANGIQQGTSTTGSESSLISAGLSGTWRACSRNQGVNNFYDENYYPTALWIRIA